MKRKGGSESLERLIERVYPSRDGFIEVQAHRAFAKSVPERLRRRATPSRVYRGVLHVNAESSAWAQELQLMAPRVLAAMKKADPTLGVRELRFRVGPVLHFEVPTPPEPPALDPVELTPTLAAAISSIRDEDVREAVLEAVRAHGEERGR